MNELFPNHKISLSHYLLCLSESLFSSLLPYSILISILALAAVSFILFENPLWDHKVHTSKRILCPYSCDFYFVPQYRSPTPLVVIRNSLKTPNFRKSQSFSSYTPWIFLFYFFPQETSRLNNSILNISWLLWTVHYENLVCLWWSE